MLKIEDQGLKIYTEEYVCPRTKRDLIELILEPTNNNGTVILDKLWPADLLAREGIVRKHYTDKRGRPDPEAGFYIRIKPFTVADKKKLEEDDDAL